MVWFLDKHRECLTSFYVTHHSSCGSVLPVVTHEAVMNKVVYRAEHHVSLVKRFQ